MTLSAGQERALRRVTTAGTKRARLLERLREAEIALYQAIREADALKVPRGLAARQGRISRQTLYTILSRKEGP